MATVGDVEAALDPGEALRYHAPLRRGGRVGLTDDRVIVVRPEESTSVHLEAIGEVTVQSFDWFLGLLSAVLVGFGALSLERSLVGGLAFVAFGLASLYWSYRKRGRVQLHLRNRRKSVTFSLAAAEEFREALGGALEQYQARLDAQAAADADD